MNRKDLKALCLVSLDAAAVEHPSGHQRKYAARYVPDAQSGERIGLMFQKDENSAPNLWVAQRFATELMEAGIDTRVYPASALYQAAGDGERRTYGRHAGLKAMRELANADLVRFTIERPGQMQFLLAALAGL